MKGCLSRLTVRSCLVALCVLWVLPAFAEDDSPLSQAEILDLFSQARELFHQAIDMETLDPEEAKALYRQAALRFERIVEIGGVRNGRLHYNIGNAHFRMGDIGRAILSYLRAERFIPNDPNLRQNLSYARSRCMDKIDEQSRKKVLRTLFFWHYDFSAKVRLAAFCVLFATIWVLASIRLLSRRFPSIWIIAVVGAISVCLLGSLSMDTIKDAGNPTGVVLSPEVVARKGDSETYQPSFENPLHAGTEFLLLDDRGNWYQIELSDGRSCWVTSKDVGLVR